MKNFALKASVAAVALAFSGLASAAVDLDAGTGTVAFASELVTNGTTALTADALDVAHTLGFGVSNTQTRYIRYDLTNATLNTAVTAADLVVAAATVAVAQGGAAGDAYVIFQITAAADYPATQAVAFGLSNGAGTADGIKVTNKSSSATISYSLYESAADAVLGGATGRLSNKNGTLGTFSTGLAFTATTHSTTANVSSLYKQFVANASNTPDGFVATNTANIGDTTFGVTGTVTPAGAAVVIGDLVAAGTKLVLTGADLSAASVGNRVYLSTDGACAAVGTAGTSITATSAEFVIGAAAVAAKGICFEANTTTPIVVQNFTLAADVVPAAGTDTADRAATALGDFNRNGTILKVPFVGGKAGQGAWVQLTNTSANDAGYTTACYKSSGASVAGAAGTITAGRSAQIYAGALCPTGNNSAVMTFAVPNGSVIGSFVRQNSTSGDMGLDGLVGNE